MNILTTFITNLVLLILIIFCAFLVLGVLVLSAKVFGPIGGIITLIVLLAAIITYGTN